MQILNFQNNTIYKNSTMKNNHSYYDRDMIGLYYPNIAFDKIKRNLKNDNIVDSLIDLMNQLDIKLIYLEKEIDLLK